MVEVLRDNGMSYRRLARIHGIDPDRFRVIRLPAENSQGISPKERRAVSGLSKIPEMYRRSYILKDVTNDEGITLRALMIPEDCPTLQLDSDDVPRECTTVKEEEMFVVTVSIKKSLRRGLDILVLVDNAESASRIAMASADRILGFSRDLLIAVPNKVSREAFIKKGKQMLDDGILPSHHVVYKVPELRLHAQKLGFI